MFTATGVKRAELGAESAWMDLPGALIDLETKGRDASVDRVVEVGIVVARALRIAARADDLFGTLIASGVAVWFAFQSFVNIGMTIGIMPITGLPLPFVSYGGSAVFADMIAIGMLQSVRRRHRVFD